MKEKYKYLSKNVLLFSLGNFVPKILSFMLVPFYTGCLSPSEYGISDLITTTVSLLLPLFTLDIQDAVLRFAMDASYNKKDVFSTGVKTIALGSALVCGGTLTVFLGRFSEFDGVWLIFLPLMFFLNAAHNSASLFCRATDQVKTIVLGSILNAVVTLLANILLLAVFQYGLIGFLIANTLGSLVALIFIVLHAKFHQYFTWQSNPSVFRDMFAFSFPLIFSVVAWWINSASDRYVLTMFYGVGISGIYAVAYKIPSLLSAFQNVFAQAWSVSAIKEFDTNDKDGFIGDTYATVNFMMVLCCSLLMVLDVPVARLLYAKDFFVAWRYVPPLLVSVVFNAMALFTGSVFTAVKDTKTLSVSTIVGAVVNTMGNFLLIPRWSAYGAALATMLGYAVTFVMRHIILRKHIRMRIRWKRDALVYLALLLQMGAAYGGVEFMLFQVALFAFILTQYRGEMKQGWALVKAKNLFR